MNALLKMIESVPGATETVGEELQADWAHLVDDDWLRMLSTGEQARVYLGVQLWNGSTPFALRDDEWNLHRAVNHLDFDGRLAFLEALSYSMPVAP